MRLGSAALYVLLAAPGTASAPKNLVLPVAVTRSANTAPRSNLAGPSAPAVEARAEETPWWVWVALGAAVVGGAGAAAAVAIGDDGGPQGQSGVGSIRGSY